MKNSQMINIKKQDYFIKKREDEIKNLKKDLKNLDKEIEKNKKRMRRMKLTTMWTGLILGLVTIILVVFVLIQEFMSVTPNMLVIVIDTIAFGMAINLIHQSYKTRHELRNQMQNEILKELEKD